MFRPKTKTRGGWRTLLDLLVLSGMLSVFYGKPLLDPSLLSLSGDSMNLFLPSVHHFRESVGGGHVPLWNSHAWLGAPFLATFQSMVFYPPQFLSLLFSPGYIGSAYALKCLTFVSLLWLTFGGYFLGWCGLRAGRLPSIFLGIALGCTGFVGGHMDHVNQVAAISWMPWILACVFSLMRKPGLRRSLALGVCFCMLILAGHPQYVAYMFVYITGLVLFFGLEGFLKHRRREIWPWRSVWLIVLGILAGVGLASMQLLPSLELSGYSVRPYDLPDRIFNGSLHLRHVFASFIPRLFGSTAHGLHGAFDEAKEYWYPYDEFVNYMGVLTAVLALTGIILRFRQWRVWVLLIMGFFSFAMAGGENLFDGVFYRALLSVLPGGGGFRVPARFMIFFVLSMTMLGALGLQSLRAVSLRRHKIHWFGYAALPLLATIVVFADLWIFSYAQAFRYQGHIEVLHHHGPILNYLKAHAGQEDARIFRLTVDPAMGSALHHDRHAEMEIIKHFGASLNVHTLKPNLPRLWGLQTMRGYEEGLLPPMNYRTYMGRAIDRGVIGKYFANKGVRKFGKQQMPHLDAVLLGLLNIKYLLVQRSFPQRDLQLVIDQDESDLTFTVSQFFTQVAVNPAKTHFFLYRNKNTIPRIVWQAPLEKVIHLRAMDSDRDALDMMHPDVRNAPRNYDYLPMLAENPFHHPTLPQLTGPDLRLHFTRPEASPNRYLVRKKSGISGRAVLIESPFPGWQCVWDGGRRPMERLNFCMMSAELTSGVTQFEFAYQPFSYRLGLFLSCVFAGLLSGLFASAGRKRQRCRIKLHAGE